MTRRASRILVGLLVVGVTASTSIASAHVGRVSATQTPTSEIGHPHTSVINGLEAASGTFPYLAFVEFNNGVEGEECSGTVVSSNVVLTAAHCVLNEDFSVLRNPSNFTVITGNVDRLAAARTVSSVSRVAVAPGFTYLTPSYLAFRDDAAVLQLSAPIAAPPVRMSTTQTWSGGTPVGLVGWGLTNAGNENAPIYLHDGESVVQSSGYCASKFSHFEAAYLICTQDYPDDFYAVCHGDSGGPLLMIAPGTTSEPLEIGIASFVQGECSTELPNYFTNVTSVEPWVATKIAEYAPPPPPVPTPVPTPAPKVAPVVAPKLPRLTSGAARSYMTKALLAGLGGRFRGRRAYTGRCREVSETKQDCGTTWTVGGTDFYGNVTIYYAFEADMVIWNNRYTIHWVDDYCYFDSGHRDSCRVRTTRK